MERILKKTLNGISIAVIYYFIQWVELNFEKFKMILSVFKIV